MHISASDLFKTGIIEQEASTALEPLCPIGITETAILPQLKPNQIRLKHPMMLVFSDYDPAIPVESISPLILNVEGISFRHNITI